MTIDKTIEAIADERHFVSGSCKGERCVCGEDATHKVGEEIPRSDPFQIRHNFTQYVCCQCFVNIVGNAAFCGLKRQHLAAELKELREFVGAMRPGSAIFTKGGAILCGGDGNWYTDHHGKFDSAIDAYRKMKAGEGE